MESPLTSFANDTTKKTFSASKWPKVKQHKPQEKRVAYKKKPCYFEVTGDLPPMLTQLKCAISSIPATSVEVERLFSAAGCFVTKLTRNTLVIFFPTFSGESYE